MLKNNKNVKSFIPDKKLENERISFSSALCASENSQLRKRGERLKYCADLFALATYENLETLDILTKHHAYFCKDRFCMICNKRRSLELLARFLPVMQQISQNSNLQCIFITLTIKNCPLSHLKSNLANMSKGFSVLYKTLSRRGFVGYVRACEYLGDNTPAGFAHPHYHCIFVVDKQRYFKEHYLTNEDLQILWKRSLNAVYFPVVDIRKIKALGKITDSNVAGLLETLKYCAKSTALEKLSDSDKEKLAIKTKAHKMLVSGGIFKNLLKDIDIDKPLSNEWRLILLEWFKYNNLEHAYNLFSTEHVNKPVDYLYKDFPSE